MAFIIATLNSLGELKLTSFLLFEKTENLWNKILKTKRYGEDGETAIF